MGRTLNASSLANLPIPLPPLEEQRRIVAKVGELMALCDELDERVAARVTFAATSRASVLSSLAHARDEIELDRAWARADASWALTVGSGRQVGDLRAVILDLAVKGSLSPQDSYEEPASSVVRQSHEARAALDAGESRSRKLKELPLIDPSDVPFQLARGWTWSRLGDVLSVCRNGLAASPNELGIGYRILRISAVNRPGFPGGSNPWKGWSHGQEAFGNEEVSA